MKNIRIFYLKIFPSLVVKFSIYLNRRVFVMFERAAKMLSLRGYQLSSNGGKLNKF